ncbi:MAG: RNA methyltransferase [Leptospiraceae bacterium]|nr:RNA methyltransferase [Leptospiraceae bacterium]MCP5493872.1 RNA methyltransferase [Leptospiraceae bacterium]
MDRVVILLENPKYPGNVGMVCRLIANFDLPPLRIIGEKMEQSYEMEWMAHNSQSELDQIEYHSTIENATLDIGVLFGTSMIYSRDRGPFFLLSDLPKMYSNANQKIGIIFGREDTGLSKKVINHCNYMLDFKLSSRQPSMNLANSVAFVMSTLHNFSVQYSETKDNFPVVEKNHFYNYSKKIFEILKMNNYHGTKDMPAKRLKTILDQRRLTKGDINFLYTFLKNIERLKNNNGSQD